MDLKDFNLYDLFIRHLNFSEYGSKKSEYETIGLDVNYLFEEKDDILYIHFEGSNSVTDWVRNFLFAKEPYKEMKISFKVHRGFLHAWKEVEDIILKKINETKKLEFKIKNKTLFMKVYKYNKICVVGYSHGGGLAILCHEFINYHRPDLKKNLISICYESPRVIARLPKDLEKRWSNCYIIRNAKDIVTHMPPKLFGYKHVGYLVQIGNKKKIEKYKLYPKCILAHFNTEVEKSLKEYEKQKSQGVNDKV